MDWLPWHISALLIKPIEESGATCHTTIIHYFYFHAKPDKLTNYPAGPYVMSVGNSWPPIHLKISDCGTVGNFMALGSIH